MKICVMRNDVVMTNASMQRVITALTETDNTISVFSRSRDRGLKNGITKKKVDINNLTIPNYELVIGGKPARGLRNLFQLILLEIRTLLWLLFSRNSYDMLHAFDLDMGLPVLVVSLVTRKKYVYHIADLYADSREGLPEKIKPFLRKLEYAVINYAETVILCTEERREQIKGSNPKKIEVVHNTPIVQETDNVSSSENNDAYNQLTITYVGNLSERRFIRHLVDTVADNPKFRLNIAGNGELVDYIDNKAKALDHINYFSYVSYQEALKMYSKTDLMIAMYDPEIANHKFSAPNKVYEAMVMGKPIIVAKHTGIDKIVLEHNMGIAIDYDRESFKELLDAISSQSIDLEKMGQNGKLAYPKYSWETMKERIKTIYQELI